MPSDRRHEVAAVRELLSDASRLGILLALRDGSSRPASELARTARVSARAAHEALRELLHAGALGVHTVGRWRYYRVASDELAQAIETLGVGRRRPRPRRPEALERARACYKHLAGTLGVSFRERLEALDLIRLGQGGAYALTAAGALRVGAFLGSERLQAGRALAGKPCLDWTERRLHIGGPLGVALLRALMERGWLRPEEGRALRVTRAGERGLRESFGVELSHG